MRSVRRAERVVDKDVGHGSQLLGKLRVVLGLALHVADVLKQHHVAVLERGGLGLGILADNVGGHDNGLAEKLAQAVGDDLEGKLGLPLALGLAHVRAEDDARAVRDQIFDGRQCGDDALVTGDFAVLGGDVEVAAAEDSLALYVDVTDRFLVVIHTGTS